MVHGLGVRPGHRLGRHRLDRGDRPADVRAPTSTTSGSPTRSPSTTSGSCKAFDEFGKLAKTEGKVLGGSQRHPQHPVRGAMTPAFDADPRVLPDAPGQLRHRASSRPTSRPTSTPRWASSSSRRSRAATRARRSSAAVTSPACSTATTTTPRPSWSSSPPTSSAPSGPRSAAGCRRTPPSTRATTPTRPPARWPRSPPSADVFRFDGSDLMPKEVGSGTFWTGMVEWMSGAVVAGDRRQDRGVLAGDAGAVVMSSATTAPPPPTITEPEPEPVRGPEPRAEPRTAGARPRRPRRHGRSSCGSSRTSSWASPSTPGGSSTARSSSGSWPSSPGSAAQPRCSSSSTCSSRGSLAGCPRGSSPTRSCCRRSRSSG